MHFQNCDYHYSLFAQHFIMEIFKNNKKWKEFYSEYSYTCHLESILYFIFYFTFFVTICSYIFYDAFQSRLQTLLLLFQLSSVQIMVDLYLLLLLPFYFYFIDLFFVWHNCSSDHMLLNIVQVLQHMSQNGIAVNRTHQLSSYSHRVVVRLVLVYSGPCAPIHAI